MAEFIMPPASKRRKSEPFRFACPSTSSSETDKTVAERHRSTNTERSTAWGVRVFKDWVRERNARTFSREKRVPEDLLDQHFTEDVSSINYWLSRFVVEARNQEGKPYPPTSIYSLLAALLRYMRCKDPDAPDFLSKKDWRFQGLRSSIESTVIALRQQGVGAEVKQPHVISPEEEDQLWEKGIFGIDTPLKLQRTVFFYVGRVFCVRGGLESRYLKPSQFCRYTKPDRYHYLANSIKSRSGNSLPEEMKAIPVYSNPYAGERCLVFLLDQYLSKLPKTADVLYLRPKPAIPRSGEWYEPIPIGREKLRTMVQDMCAAAGIAERKNNRSLGAEKKPASHGSLECLIKNARPSKESSFGNEKFQPTPVSGGGGQGASTSSPVTTAATPPTLWLTHPVTGDGLAQTPDYSGVAGRDASVNFPPASMRMACPLLLVPSGWAPSPNPPGNDQHPSVHPPVSQALVVVSNYNEDIDIPSVPLKEKVVAVPSVPVKKKIVDTDAVSPVPLNQTPSKAPITMYKGLVEDSAFDESHMLPLYIHGMDALPPLPRRRLENSADEEPEEVTNYLECEDASGYLIFSKLESGGYTLHGGLVDVLIAYSASDAMSVKQFSETFLLTYSTFITPGELITKLLYRLRYFYQLDTLAVWQATTSFLVRVLTRLRHSLSKESQVELIHLIDKMITDRHFKFARLLRDALVEKLNQLMIETVPSIPLGIAFRTIAQCKKSIVDFNPETVARQMTILDSELFQKVDVCEMLYWAKDQNEERSPMLTQFALHFNDVSQWTKAALLKRGLDMESRCKLMDHFIAIMKSLLESLKNFNSYLAILSAIESSPISRLDWPDEIVKRLEEPRQLIDRRGSYKKYREAFTQAKLPCIPYIGLCLQDLAFIEMQPDKLGEAINFTKRWIQFKCVDHVRLAQTKQYSYDPDPELLRLFNNFEVKETEEDLWAISTEIKPRQTSNSVIIID